ncbi:MAG: hypothetical protein ABI743_13720 [bacterium]
MRRLLIVLALATGLLTGGCQEITPPRIKQLAVSDLSRQEAREIALQRIRLGDLHLLAGYYDLAYENYWIAYRKWNEDFTPGSLDDVDALVQALGLKPGAVTAANFEHGTIARIALALDLQKKYRLLAWRLEYFASENQAGSRESAVDYLNAAGYYYYRGGLPTYALPVLKKAVSIDPSSLQAYENLAVVSENLKEDKSALSYWRILWVIAQRLDPSDPDQAAALAYYQETTQTHIDALVPLVEGGK